MRKIQAALTTLLLAAFAIWAMWQVIKPVIPYIAVALALLFILSTLVYRRRS